jgi:hypothetical protein
VAAGNQYAYSFHFIHLHSSFRLRFLFLASFNQLSAALALPARKAVPFLADKSGFDTKDFKVAMLFLYAWLAVPDRSVCVYL